MLFPLTTLGGSAQSRTVKHASKSCNVWSSGVLEHLMHKVAFVIVDLFLFCCLPQLVTSQTTAYPRPVQSTLPSPPPMRYVPGKQEPLVATGKVSPDAYAARNGDHPANFTFSNLNPLWAHITLERRAWRGNAAQ
jgi:hypothetical protein